MQVWPVTRKLAGCLTAGKSVGPSTTAMSMSRRPWALGSFITGSQNVAPSVFSTHRLGISLRPLQVTSIAK